MEPGFWLSRIRMREPVKTFWSSQLWVLLCIKCLILNNDLIDQDTESPDRVDAVDTNESYFFGVMETIFVGWFTFIFVVRLILAPDKVSKENKGFES